MNKALHRFYLFALNRLSEAQRGANRGLSLTSLINHLILAVFLTALSISENSSAAEYSYAMTGSPDTRFATPFLACNSWVGHHGFLKVLNVKFHGESDPRYGCEFLYDFMYAVSPGKPEYIMPWWREYVVDRFGDTCPPGSTYNDKNGECVDSGPGGQKGPPPPLSCAGDPINTANGNSYQVETDYPSNGASTLNFTRTYNSLDGVWRHNYSTHLRFAGASVALVMNHGRESYFTVNGSTVTAAPTELGSLLKTADGWLYTAENNERFSFDATGRLTRWTNASGAEHLLSYVNGSVTVTDNLGQTLSFTEDAQHQPLTLTTAGLTIKYDYNANQRLSQLTRTRGGQIEQRLFHYEIPNKPNLLTGITDERGVRFATWTFDDQGRATSSEHNGGAEHTQVAYNADGSSTVTNEFGKKSIYRFVTIAGVKRVSAIEGEALGSCPMSNSTYAYDERGLLKTKTDNKGHLTTYDYNERGLEISRTEAAGTAQARTITTTWHATFNLPLTVTEPGRITTYTYDTQGRQLSQTRTAL